MAYKRLCDLCGKEIDSVFFDPRRIEYKRRIFGVYKTVDICQGCAEEMEKHIKERVSDGAEGNNCDNNKWPDKELKKVVEWVNEEPNRRLRIEQSRSGYIERAEIYTAGSLYEK